LRAERWGRGFGDLSVIVVSRQTLARTWFCQPPLRHLIIEWIEAEDRNVHRMTAARRKDRNNIAAAPHALMLYYGLARFDLEVRFPTFKPLMFA
jgi:hypothetical protein